MYALIIPFLFWGSMAHADAGVGKILCDVIDKNFEVGATTVNQVLAAKTRAEALEILQRNGIKLAVAAEATDAANEASAQNTALSLLKTAAAEESHEWDRKARRDFSSLDDRAKAAVGRFLLASENKDKVTELIKGKNPELATERYSNKTVKGEIKDVYRTKLESGNYVRFYVHEGKPHILAVD